VSNTLTARNPRTGQLDFEIPVMDQQAVFEEGRRLRSSQSGWQAIGFEGRASRLGTLATALLDQIDPIASALEVDTGRRRIARMEVDAVAAALKAWAHHIPENLGTDWIQGLSSPTLKHKSQLVPYDLVGVISPWNFPLILSMIDAAPALLAGCAVMIKPSEVTSRFVAPLEAAINAAGLSPVLGFVTGAGETGAALVDQVDAVCFTGSVPTGRKVAVQAAGRLIPAFLELGGKDPLIVLASADVEAATDAALRGSVQSTGQACQSIERIYVDASIHDAFLTRLVEKAESVRLNAGDITKGEIGPIIFEKQAETLAAHIEDAKSKGANVLTGGEIEHHSGGLWLRPTILSAVTHDMRVMTEETFGPILPVMAFETVEDAINLANDSDYGLSAAVFAGTLAEAETIAEDIEAGAISLNDAALTALFHEAEKNAFKSSGLGGSRMGAAGLQRFLRRKALIANTARPLPITALSEDAE
jgi:acyl-CoA reductase-like NAD-dependent aldehyde dehydrogenase